MEAYHKTVNHRDLKLSEIMILAGVAIMYSGLIIAVLGMIVK